MFGKKQNITSDKLRRFGIIAAVTIVAASLMAVPLNNAIMSAEARQLEKVVFLDHGKKSKNPHAASGQDPCGEGSNRFSFLEGKPGWTQFPVTYYLDMTGFEASDSVTIEQAEAALVTSFETWDAEEHPQTQLFSQVFDPAEATLTVSWTPYDGAAGIVAYAAVTYVTQTQEIIHADIVLDNDDKWFIGEENNCTGGGDSFDIQNVATHEIGHALGLDHVDDEALTMYPFVTTGETLKRSLGLGDVRGLNKVY